MFSHQPTDTPFSAPPVHTAQDIPASDLYGVTRDHALTLIDQGKDAQLLDEIMSRFQAAAAHGRGFHVLVGGAYNSAASIQNHLTISAALGIDFYGVGSFPRCVVHLNHNECKFYEKSITRQQRYTLIETLSRCCGAFFSAPNFAPSRRQSSFLFCLLWSMTALGMGFVPRSLIVDSQKPETPKRRTLLSPEISLFTSVLKLLEEAREQECACWFHYECKRFHVLMDPKVALCLILKYLTILSS
jgi:hypothetical protein